METVDTRIFLCNTTFALSCYDCTLPELRGVAHKRSHCVHERGSSCQFNRDSLWWKSNLMRTTQGRSELLSRGVGAKARLLFAQTYKIIVKNRRAIIIFTKQCAFYRERPRKRISNLCDIITIKHCDCPQTFVYCSSSVLRLKKEGRYFSTPATFAAECTMPRRRSDSKIMGVAIL